MAGMWIVHAGVAVEELFGSYVARAREILTSHGATYIARGVDMSGWRARTRPGT
jgi:uncharacterized protein (DUF1330 family)